MSEKTMVHAVLLPAGREPFPLNVTLSAWTTQPWVTAWPPVDSNIKETIRLLAVSQPMSQVDSQEGADPGSPIVWWVKMATFFTSHL